MLQYGTKVFLETGWSNIRQYSVGRVRSGRVTVAVESGQGGGRVESGWRSSPVRVAVELGQGNPNRDIFNTYLLTRLDWSLEIWKPLDTARGVGYDQRKVLGRKRPHVLFCAWVLGCYMYLGP